MSYLLLRPTYMRKEGLGIWLAKVWVGTHIHEKGRAGDLAS